MGTTQPGADFSDDGGHEPRARQSSAHIGRHLSVDAVQIRLLEALPCTAAISGELLVTGVTVKGVLSSWVCVTELTALAVAGS